MNKRRVVITGLGTINAVGQNVNETWEGLVAGKSGIDRITKFDPSDFTSQIAGEIKDYNPKDHFIPKEIKKIDLYTQYAIIAADEAIENAGLKEGNYDPFRAGVITGAGIGGMLAFEQEVAKYIKSGPRRISPFFIPKMISNIAAAHISIKHNLKGVNFNCVSACASANHAMGTALRMIQHGDADIVVSGGAEASVTPVALGGFCSMKALSTRNDNPQEACSPFDVKRDGFVMAEGAGILVLEELEHALKRGANIIAEIAGYGATGDAFHVTAPAAEGEAGAKAIDFALADAGLEKSEVDYFNAHGTSTPLNDKTETVIIKRVFGDHVNNLNISSTKSMVGHSLGAAAGIEGISCCKTIETGIIHPTINYQDPDPDCDLNYTPNNSVERDVRVAISNSLGFGGHNSVIVFKKYEN